MAKLTESAAFKQFEEQKRRIRNATTLPKESYSEKAARMERLKTDYRAYFSYYFPHWCDEGKTDCADYHVEIAENLLHNRIINQLNVIYRGGAKSTHSNIGAPLWLMLYHGELKFMLLIGDTEPKAQLLLSDIQAELQENQRIIADFGEQFRHGHWADGEFKTKGGVFFKAIGLDQDARGLRNNQYRPDYISVDDVDSRKLAKNQTLVKEYVSKILGDIKGAFSKDRQRLVISNNMIARDGILAKVIDKIKRFKSTRITWRNAVDEHGEPTWPQRYTRQYWEDFEAETPPIDWRREWMNDPVEEGSIFKEIHWGEALPWKAYRAIISNADPSFKSTSKSDYKAAAVVGELDGRYDVLEAFCEQTSISKFVRWHYDIFERAIKESVTIQFYIEAGFIQDLLLDEFDREGKARGYQLGIRKDTRKKDDKFMRIEALSPLNESGLITFDQSLKNQPQTERATAQMLAFERGVKHDDFPDALEGAIWLLRRLVISSKVQPRTVKRRQNTARGYAR